MKKLILSQWYKKIKHGVIQLIIDDRVLIKRS